MYHAYPRLLIITHDGSSTNRLPTSSRCCSQRYSTGLPRRLYPKRWYSRTASSFPIATSRLTSARARSSSRSFDGVYQSRPDSLAPEGLSNIECEQP